MFTSAGGGRLAAVRPPLRGEHRAWRDKIQAPEREPREHAGIPLLHGHPGLRASSAARPTGRPVVLRGKVRGDEVTTRGQGSSRLATISAGLNASGVKCRSPTSSRATGWLKSSTARAAGGDKIASGSRTSSLAGTWCGPRAQRSAGRARGQGREGRCRRTPHGKRGRPLRDLVDVIGGRQAAADVEELAEPASAVRNLTAQPRNARFSRAATCALGELPQHLRRRLAVGREVVLPADEVVVDACGMRFAEVLISGATTGPGARRSAGGPCGARRSASRR